MMFHAFLAFLCAVVLSAIGRDCYAWLPRLQRWLLNCAAASIPTEIRKTFHEECLAEIEQLPNAELYRTLRAFGFLTAAWRIGLERSNALTLFEDAGFRSVDIACSMLLIFLLLPMLFVISLLIKRSDGGPILYRQLTVGRGGHCFRAYRFRTTCVEGDRCIASGIAMPKENDSCYFEGLLCTAMQDGESRLTRHGRWLLHAGLHSLPLLLNVLWGEMTLVGPRPCNVRWFETLSDATRDAYLAFKPGLTSPAAFQGLVGEEAYTADCRYLKNRKFVSDGRMLLAAAAAIVTGAGMQTRRSR